MLHSPARMECAVQDLRLVLNWPEPPSEVAQKKLLRAVVDSLSDEVEHAQVVWSQFAGGDGHGRDPRAGGLRLAGDGGARQGERARGIGQDGERHRRAST